MYDFLSHLQEPLPRSHRLRRLHRPHEELLRRIICQHLRRARRNPPLSPPKPPNSPPPALSPPDPGSTASLAESSTCSTRRRTFGAASTSPCLRPAQGTSAPSRSTTASLTTETMTARLLSNFLLLQHQRQIVESFEAQISLRSRERLLDQALGLGIATPMLSLPLPLSTSSSPNRHCPCFLIRESRAFPSLHHHSRFHYKSTSPCETDSI
ncbi:uncharacterized protein LOC130753059 [Actinidia eriantha]|uniref:uncharacterized protein LOC130753059 n=1 Tax=Actinidia eriantha TaxID=165200 RepID=UPI00258E6E15|nr:uncharacterized protein LOC130753059 [Actinidia eriantha]